MICRLLPLACIVVLLAAEIPGAEAKPPFKPGGEWPVWCGRPDRNMVSDERGLPDSFEEHATGKTGPEKLRNVRWCVPLGTGTGRAVYGSPVVAGGKLLLGGCDSGGGKDAEARLWCFRESDGKLLWQFRSSYWSGLYNRAFGICSTPSIEGERVYFLGQLGEVLCLDANGLANGNDGPFLDEERLLATGRKVAKSEVRPDGGRIIELTPGQPRRLEPTDADILWRFDMLRDARCYPFNALSSGVLILGDHLFLGTGSVHHGHTGGKLTPAEKGLGGAHAKGASGVTAKDQTAPAGAAPPCVIVLDKATGKLLATDEAKVFDETFHGAHSTPCLGTVNGKELVFYGTGSGKCLAFDPEFAPGPEGRPAVLKTVWRFDCLDPATYNPGDHSGLRRAETVATPVFYKKRIYIAVGNDLRNSGTKAGAGHLVCIDATQTGDITKSGKLWSCDAIRSSSSTVAISDGLLYAADAAGYVYCLDAETGKLYWQHLCPAPMWGSPLAADGKVYAFTYGRGLVVFAAGKEKRILSQANSSSSFAASPAVAHGTLFAASHTHLYAIQSQGGR